MKFAFVGAALSLVLATTAHAVPAFPGAVGGGAASVGGRGGVVIPVTNLADSGPGSLRACVGARGPRTCVFRVAGTIRLRTGLWIANPYLTVAGQTAPGGGIQISAKDMPGHAIMIATHNVIWRYTRIRHGYNPNGNDQGSNLVMFSGTHDVVIDHNSAQWNQDEGIGLWRGESPAVYNITISNNLVGEGLDPHSTGYISGAQSRTWADGITNVDFVCNLTMNNNHRNPLIKHKTGRVVNNIFYNSKYYFSQVGGGGQIDFLGNIYKRGPMSTSGAREIQVYPNGNATTPNGSPSIHVAGNRGFQLAETATDQWPMTAYVPSENGTQSGALSTAYRRTSPLPQPPYAISRVTTSQLEASLLPVVGASQRLDCEGRWVTNRDSTDARMVYQYQSNTGIARLPYTEQDVGGYPVIATGTPCADADSDGMPDSFERARGLDPYSAADGNRIAGSSGYTNLETYLAGN